MREEALLLEHKKTTQYHDMDDHNAVAVMENMQFFLCENRGKIHS